MRKTIISMIVLGGMIILISAISGCKTAGPAVESTKKTVKLSPVPDKAAGKTRLVKPIKVSSAPEKPTKKPPRKPIKKPTKKPVVPRRADAGHLSVDKLTHDFGVVAPSRKQKTVFVLTNDGKEDLKITKVETGCGCTKQNFKPNTILKPGESFDLEIVYTPKTVARKYIQRIVVYTAAPAMPVSQVLKIIATVKKMVDVKPEKLRFKINKSSKNEGVIVLESTDGKEFKVVGYSSGAQKPVIIKFDKKTKATRHELTYTVDVAKLRRMPRGRLTINISHPNLKRAYLRYESVFPFSARPPNRHFKALKPGVPQKAVIKVVSNFGKKFELGNITSQKGLIKVLGTSKSKDGYRIEISFTASAEETTAPDKGESSKKPRNRKRRTRVVRDHLSIEIKDHPEDTLKVLCYGTVKK